METPNLPRPDKPLFFATIPVHKHVVKKNNRPIFKNRGSGMPFLGKSDDLRLAERQMLAFLTIAKGQKQIHSPIEGPLHICFRFYFDDFLRKDGDIRKTLPDLSNLVQLPEDILQEAGIIKDDRQICSLDGSRRLPGKSNVLAVWIWPLDE